MGVPGLGWGLAVWAAGPPKKDWLETLWLGLGLVGLLLVGALVIRWADRWRKREAEPPETSDDQMTHFRQLYEKGEMSAEEFEKVRGLLGRRLREDLEVPPPERPQNPPESGARADPPP
jgi:hypothetical protein